jgi:glucose-induced degradation protein 4
MPVKIEVIPPLPANSRQPGIAGSLLYNGSKFQGFQKSKGNSYEVEVVLQV